MDRALTMRILPLAAALLLALTGCAGKGAGVSKSRASIYGQAPASSSDPGFAKFAGFAVGVARICQRYQNTLIGDERIGIIRDRLSGREGFDKEVERMRRRTRGVDGWRGDMHSICKETGRRLGEIVAALNAKPAETAPTIAGPPKVGQVRGTYFTTHGRELFSNVAEPDSDNPSFSLRRLKEMGVGAFNLRISALLENVRPGAHRYEIRSYEPDGALAAAKGYEFTAATSAPRVQTTHRGVVSYMSARPGRWRMEFFLDGEKIGERTVLISP